MNILIDNKSGEPIYNQIYSQIKNQIISGELKENEMLPSIRGLAKDLRISFIVVLLPAPFSPISPIIQPLGKVRLMLSKQNPEKDLLTFFISSAFILIPPFQT